MRQYSCKLKFQRFFVLLSLALVAACTTTATKSTNDAYQRGLDKVAQLQKASETSLKPSTDGKLPFIYLGSKAVPLRNTDTLPAGFYAVKKLEYPGQRFTIAQAASMLSAETGMPIRVAQDVYNITGTTAAAPAPGAGTTAAGARPVTATSQQMNGAKEAAEALNNLSFNFDKNLIGALDHICSQTGLNWEYRNGVAVIQRLVTRSFTLKVQPGARVFTTSNAKTGNSQASNTTQGAAGGGAISTGITAAATVTTNSGELNPLNSVTEAVKAVLTPGIGKAIADQTAGTITVIDNIDGVERAEKIVDRENEILNRYAKVRITIMTFQETRADQVGIDWSAVFQNFGKFGMTLTSPQTLTNNQGGSIGMQIIQGTGAKGPFDGTQAFANLLNDLGKSHTVYDEVIRARNRVATPTSNTNQTVYLAQTTPAAATVAGATGGVPGLTPGTITTGFDLQIQPNIYDSNQMSLLFSLGVLNLVDILTLSSGTGSNQQSIQGPETSGYNFQQDVPLLQGETALVTGYENTLNSYTRRALGDNIPMLAGGSFSGSLSSQKLFIFITPVEIGTTY